MMNHTEAQQSLGSYVLGALDAADRAAVEEHLTTCATCRAELVTFAGLPGLMGRLTVQEVRDGRLQPPPSLLPATITAVDNERSQDIRRVRRWRAGALTAIGTAAAACAALIIALSTGTATAPAPAARPMVAASSGAATGAISLQSKPWGTQIHLVLGDLPREGTFTAWTVSTDGRRTTAATWRATPNGKADVTGAAPIDPDAISNVQITTADGTTILRG